MSRAVMYRDTVSDVIKSGLYSRHVHRHSTQLWSTLSWQQWLFNASRSALPTHWHNFRCTHNSTQMTLNCLWKKWIFSTEIQSLVLISRLPNLLSSMAAQSNCAKCTNLPTSITYQHMSTSVSRCRSNAHKTIQPTNPELSPSLTKNPSKTN